MPIRVNDSVTFRTNDGKTIAAVVTGFRGQGMADLRLTDGSVRRQPVANLRAMQTALRNSGNSENDSGNTATVEFEDLVHTYAEVVVSYGCAPAYELENKHSVAYWTNIAREPLQKVRFGDKYVEFDKLTALMLAAATQKNVTGKVSREVSQALYAKLITAKKRIEEQKEKQKGSSATLAVKQEKQEQLLRLEKLISLINDMTGLEERYLYQNTLLNDRNFAEASDEQKEMNVQRKAYVKEIVTPARKAVSKLFGNANIVKAKDLQKTLQVVRGLLQEWAQQGKQPTVFTRQDQEAKEIQEEYDYALQVAYNKDAHATITALIRLFKSMTTANSEYQYWFTELSTLPHTDRETDEANQPEENESTVKQTQAGQEQKKRERDEAKAKAAAEAARVKRVDADRAAREATKQLSQKNIFEQAVEPGTSGVWLIEDDPLRVSPDNMAFCGNAIDGKAYAIIMPQQKVATVKWLTFRDIGFDEDFNFKPTQVVYTLNENNPVEISPVFPDASGRKKKNDKTTSLDPRALFSAELFTRQKGRRELQIKAGRGATRAKVYIANIMERDKLWDEPGSANQPYTVIPSFFDKRDKTWLPPLLANLKTQVPSGGSYADTLWGTDREGYMSSYPFRFIQTKAKAQRVKSAGASATLTPRVALPPDALDVSGQLSPDSPIVVEVGQKGEPGYRVFGFVLRAETDKSYDVQKRMRLFPPFSLRNSSPYFSWSAERPGQFVAAGLNAEGQIETGLKHREPYDYLCPSKEQKALFNALNRVHRSLTNTVRVATGLKQALYGWGGSTSTDVLDIQQQAWEAVVKRQKTEESQSKRTGSSYYDSLMAFNEEKNHLTPSDALTKDALQKLQRARTSLIYRKNNLIRMCSRTVFYAWRMRDNVVIPASERREGEDYSIFSMPQQLSTLLPSPAKEEFDKEIERVTKLVTLRAQQYTNEHQPIVRIKKADVITLGSTEAEQTVEENSVAFFATYVPTILNYFWGSDTDTNSVAYYMNNLALSVQHGRQPAKFSSPEGLYQSLLAMLYRGYSFFDCAAAFIGTHEDNLAELPNKLDALASILSVQQQARKLREADVARDSQLQLIENVDLPSIIAQYRQQMLARVLSTASGTKTESAASSDTIFRFYFAQLVRWLADREINSLPQQNGLHWYWRGWRGASNQDAIAAIYAYIVAGYSRNTFSGPLHIAPSSLESDDDEAGTARMNPMRRNTGNVINFPGEQSKSTNSEKQPDGPSVNADRLAAAAKADELREQINRKRAAKAQAETDARQEAQRQAAQRKLHVVIDNEEIQKALNTLDQKMQNQSIDVTLDHAITTIRPYVVGGDTLQNMARHRKGKESQSEKTPQVRVLYTYNPLLFALTRDYGRVLNLSNEQAKTKYQSLFAGVNAIGTYGELLHRTREAALAYGRRMDHILPRTQKELFEAVLLDNPLVVDDKDDTKLVPPKWWRELLPEHNSLFVSWVYQLRSDAPDWDKIVGEYFGLLRQCKEAAIRGLRIAAKLNQTHIRPMRKDLTSTTAVWHPSDFKDERTQQLITLLNSLRRELYTAMRNSQDKKNFSIETNTNKILAAYLAGGASIADTQEKLQQGEQQRKNVQLDGRLDEILYVSLWDDVVQPLLGFLAPNYKNVRYAPKDKSWNSEEWKTISKPLVDTIIQKLIMLPTQESKPMAPVLSRTIAPVRDTASVLAQVKEREDLRQSLLALVEDELKRLSRKSTARTQTTSDDSTPLPSDGLPPLPFDGPPPLPPQNTDDSSRSNPAWPRTRTRFSRR